jgi:hypothetical protein
MTLAIATSSPSLAEDTGALVGTVTAADMGACIVVGASSIDFGTNPFSSIATGAPLYEGVVDGTTETRFAIENCGFVDWQLAARGSNAASQTSAAVWSLSEFAPCSMGANYYNLDAFWETSTTTENISLVTTDIQLPTGPIAPAESLMSGASITMPCDNSTGAGEVFDLEIVYTAIAS